MAEKKRFVDVDHMKKLMLLALDLSGQDAFDRGDLEYSFDNAPTVDAVEVVRCKDCVKEGTVKCPMVHRDPKLGNLYAETNSMVFCSYGERKTDEN